MTKNHKIKYLSSFAKELNNIIYYITYVLQNPIAASHLLDSIDISIKNISLNPKSYENYISRKNRDFVWYRIYVNNYVIFYTVRNEVMEVAHILYNKRDFDKLI